MVQWVVHWLTGWFKGGCVQLPFRYTFIFSLIVSISNVGSTAGVNFIARRFEVADEREGNPQREEGGGSKGARKCVVWTDNRIDTIEIDGSQRIKYEHSFPKTMGRVLMPKTPKLPSCRVATIPCPAPKISSSYPFSPFRQPICKLKKSFNSICGIFGLYFFGSFRLLLFL